jgi:hypothetical protein
MTSMLDDKTLSFTTTSDSHTFFLYDFAQVHTPLHSNFNDGVTMSYCEICTRYVRTGKGARVTKRWANVLDGLKHVTRPSIVKS